MKNPFATKPEESTPKEEADVETPGAAAGDETKSEAMADAERMEDSM